MPEHTHSLDTFWEASPVWQEMHRHTHILNTFSESTVSQSSLTRNAWTYSHSGQIFREHCQPVQCGRKCLDTLTHWTHFQRALSASPVWQQMPGHTHILGTFPESTVSQSSLAANAWTHSHSGHMFREHCQPVQFGRKCLDTLTAWTHFQRAMSASPVWQEMKGNTHILDTFWESNVSQSSLAANAWTHSHSGHIFREHCQPVQFDQKCLDTLTHWTHFQRALSASCRKCQDTLTAWTHFQRALSASPVWQKMPEHTHILDTFSESTISQSSLAGNARTHSPSGHIFREHCQPIQFGRENARTHTFLIHFQTALSVSPVRKCLDSHSKHSFKEVSGVCQDIEHTHSLNIFSANPRSNWNETSWISSPSIYNISICFPFQIILQWTHILNLIPRHSVYYNNSILYPLPRNSINPVQQFCCF